MCFNQKIMLKTELCFKKKNQEKGEFVKLKAKVRGIIIFYLYVIFSCMKNVENQRKSRS